MFEKNVSNPIKTLGKASSLLLLLICFLPITACANSSWVWIAETRPIDILPFVVVGTLVFETMVILFMARPQSGNYFPCCYPCRRISYRVLYAGER